MKNLFETDWEKEILPEEILTLQNKPTIPLAALQRLGRMANTIDQHVELMTPSPNLVQAIFTTTFKVGNDLVTFVGSADCGPKNADEPFVHYPTAVAESRAEARCLRRALGIKMLSTEEIGFQGGSNALEVTPASKIASSVVVAIEKLCETHGISQASALEDALENKERAAMISELNELTMAEGQAVMSWLNAQKPKSKPRSKS